MTLIIEKNVMMIIGIEKVSINIIICTSWEYLLLCNYDTLYHVILFLKFKNLLLAKVVQNFLGHNVFRILCFLNLDLQTFIIYARTFSVLWLNAALPPFLLTI